MLLVVFIEQLLFEFGEVCAFLLIGGDPLFEGLDLQCEQLTVVLRFGRDLPLPQLTFQSNLLAHECLVAIERPVFRLVIAVISVVRGRIVTVPEYVFCFCLSC